MRTATIGLIFTLGLAISGCGLDDRFQPNDLSVPPDLAVGCHSSAECSQGNVCSIIAHSCGPCHVNDECPPTAVCDTRPSSASTTSGQCIPVDYVVSAQADNNTADGSPAHPFSTLSRAIDILKAAGKTSAVIHVMAGKYADVVRLDFATATTITLFGDGIDKTIVQSPDPHDSGIVRLLNSNSLVVSGITVEGSAASGFYCDRGLQTFKAYQARFTANSNFGISGNGCTIYLDGVRVDGNHGGGIEADGDFDIENSLIVNNDDAAGNFQGIGVTLNSLSATRIVFVNNTVASNKSRSTSAVIGVYCKARATDIIIGNTILWSNTSSNNITNETNCLTAYSATDDATFAKPMDQVLTADPAATFVNATNGDYHLLATSKCAAAGAANPAASVTAPDHDLELNPRPGPIDIGAYRLRR